MRKKFTIGAIAMAAAAPALFAAPAVAQTGAPIGGCAVGGGWVVSGYAPDNGSAIAVDQVYGNNDGLLCVKLPSAHAPYPILVDNTVAPAASG